MVYRQPRPAVLHHPQRRQVEAPGQVAVEPVGDERDHRGEDERQRPAEAAGGEGDAAAGGGGEHFIADPDVLLQLHDLADVLVEPEDLLGDDDCRGRLLGRGGIDGSIRRAAA
mgnify:CR=1 FL=1